MFRHALRPLSRSLRSRQLSTSTSTPIPSRRNLYLSTAVATFGLTAFALSQRDVIRNDSKANVSSSSDATLPGSANWKPSVAQYDEDLKVNRHKIAAQKGTTPDSPLHNTSTSPTSKPSQHISSSRLSPEAHNVRKGDGTQGEAAPEVVKEKAEEGKAESAYNEETGEINWDCPCLGGMAQGPCGEDFKAAFSCFVHSDQEPKGIDCVEKFKGMQDCFRKYPDIYGEELEDSDEPPEPFGQPTSTDGPGPLSAGTVSGSPLPEGHPDKANVPRTPVKEPPKNSVIAKQTHENNPAKGIEKLQPRGDRADKKGKPAGDGTI